MAQDPNHIKSLPLVSILVRQKCFELCNPGALKQRMVKHGRDIQDNWTKLENFKKGCILGCDFAAHAEKLVSAKEKEQLIKISQDEEVSAKAVLPQESIDVLRKKRNDWLDTLRGHCFDKCKAAFPEATNGKPQKFCSDGCDYFFSIIAEN